MEAVGGGAKGGEGIGERGRKKQRGEGERSEESGRGRGRGAEAQRRRGAEAQRRRGAEAEAERDGGGEGEGRKEGERSILSDDRTIDQSNLSGPTREHMTIIYHRDIYDLQLTRSNLLNKILYP